MSGFLNTHSALQKEIEESCEVVNILRDKYSEISNALDALTYMQSYLTRNSKKLDSVKPNSEENKNKLEKLEQDVKRNFENYKKVLAETAEKYALHPNLTNVAGDINSAWEEVYDDLNKTNNQLVEMKFSEDDSTDTLEQYRAIVARDASNISWHTLTFESTADSPVEISIWTRNDNNSTLQEELYKHEINNIKKGGTEIIDPSMVDERLPSKRFVFGAQLVAVNGRYLKDQNREEIKPLLQKEIATGKVILDIVRPNSKPLAYPKVPHAIAMTKSAATETSLPNSTEVELETVDNKKAENQITNAVAPVIEPSATLVTMVPNSTEVEHTTVDNKKTIAPTAQTGNGSHFGWSDVLLTLVVALATVIISILIA